MSPKAILWLAVLVVCAYPAAASTRYVGTCKSGSYSTIGDAVLAAPSGSTILICPGIYIEQVIISADLTLKGLDTSSAEGGTGALIYSPGTMWPTTSAIFTSYELGGPITPVIWVTAGTVTIENVSVVNSVDYCPSSNTKTVGFYYQSGASGTLNHVGFFGFGQECAIGILAENASSTHTAVTVENSYSAAGIVAGSLATTVDGTLTVTIKGNQVFPTAPYGSFGIYLYGVSGTVESNFVSGPRLDGGGYGEGGTAIFADGVAQTNVTISGNTIQVNDNFLSRDGGETWGIDVTVDGATVKGNKITGPQIGILMNCHAGTVSGNTISFAYDGIANVPAGSLGVNTFYNTASKTSTC